MAVNITCESFAGAAEDFALGFAPSPQRDDLSAHANSCASCAADLRELTVVADALLELAPEADPAAGFEARAIAAMRPPASSPAQRPATPRPSFVASGAVAAAAILLLAFVAVRPDNEVRPVVADIEGSRGRLGRVELVAEPSPKVVVLMEDDSWKDVWVCELEDDDGAWVEVGRWTADEATGGAWAVTVDGSLLDATRMRITSTSGAVIATSDPLR